MKENQRTKGCRTQYCKETFQTVSANICNLNTYPSGQY